MMEVGRRKPANNGAYTGGKCGGRCLGPKWACGGRIRIVTTKRDKLQSVPMTRCRQDPHLFSQITHKDKPLVVKNPLRKAVFFSLFLFLLRFVSVLFTLVRPASAAWKWSIGSKVSVAGLCERMRIWNRFMHVGCVPFAR